MGVFSYLLYNSPTHFYTYITHSSNPTTHISLPRSNYRDQLHFCSTCQSLVTASVSVLPCQPQPSRAHHALTPPRCVFNPQGPNSPPPNAPLVAPPTSTVRPSGSSGLRSPSPEARSSPASNGAEIYRKERPIHAPILRAERGLDCPSSFPPHPDSAPMGDEGGRERDRGGAVPVCPRSDRRHRQPLTRYHQDRLHTRSPLQRSMPPHLILAITLFSRSICANLLSDKSTTTPPSQP